MRIQKDIIRMCYISVDDSKEKRRARLSDNSEVEGSEVLYFILGLELC